jgi:hypothetical protein
MFLIYWSAHPTRVKVVVTRKGVSHGAQSSPDVLGYSYNSVVVVFLFLGFFYPGCYSIAKFPSCGQFDFVFSFSLSLSLFFFCSIVFSNEKLRENKEREILDKHRHV